jgi:hypothetical protein
MTMLRWGIEEEMMMLHFRSAGGEEEVECDSA